MLLCTKVCCAGALGIELREVADTNNDGVTDWKEFKQWYSETHQAKLGPIELSVKEKQTVNFPAWAGVAAIVVGGVLVLFGGRKG